MTGPSRQAVSLRDPAGFVFLSDEAVYRFVRPSGTEQLQAFLGSACHRALREAEQVVLTEPASPPAELLPERSDREDGKWFRHSRIEIRSFAHEWPAPMLHAAAELTLRIAEGLLEDGLGLKDATPNNVMFEGPRPVFIDVLSAERRDAGDPIWLAYAQFARSFLLPLLLFHDFGIPPSDLLLARRDGVEPAEASKLFRSLACWRRDPFALAILPVWLSTLEERREGPPLVATRRRLVDPDQARWVLRSLLRKARRRLARLKPVQRRSAWSGYMATRDHYGDAAEQAKDGLVTEMLATAAPRWVLDVGCNTGRFSRLAVGAGARVIAIDRDEEALGRLFREAASDGLDILPLRIDFARPTPGLGWENREQPSFLDRAEGRFDLVLALAVLHHLLVTDGIPLNRILSLFARLSRRHVLVELVPSTDPMFLRISRGRDALHAGFGAPLFEAEVLHYFRILRNEPVADSGRRLYLLEKR